MRNALLLFVFFLAGLLPEYAYASKNRLYQFDQTNPSFSTPCKLNIAFERQEVSCTSGQDGYLKAVVTDGQAPYEYVWNTRARTQTINNLGAGLYSVTVTDAKGCKQSRTTKITEPDPLTIHPSVTNVSCERDDDGSIKINVKGGTAPYTFQWEDGDIGYSRENLSPGEYFITVMDANGCTTPISVKVLDFPTPQLTIQVEPPTCSGGNQDGRATVVPTGGTPPYNIAWSTGATQQTTISNLSPGNYDVTVTNAEGCSSVGHVAIPTGVANFNINVAADNFVCGDEATGSATITATGDGAPFTYAWNHGPTEASLSNLTAGTYNITVTDNKGCTKTAYFNLEEREIPDLAIRSTEEICFGTSDGELTAVITGGTAPYNVAWSTGAATISIQNVPAGTYGVTATDAVGCSIEAERTINSTPEIFYNPSFQPVTCHEGSDGQISVVVSGGTGDGFSYSWSNGATTTSLNNLVAGTYTVTITDNGSNCALVREIIISEPSPIVVATNTINASSENESDGAVLLEVTGGTPPYTYNWSNGATTQNIENVPSGTYAVTITDANGCTEVVTVVINANCVLEVQLFPLPITCLGNDGALVAEPRGTNHTVTYNWSTGTTGRSIINLSPGTYSVTATDAVGCTASASITLEDNQFFINDDAITTTPVSCHGGSNGSISVTASSGTGDGFSYAWSNGQTGATITNIPAGNYTVSITDLGNNCTITRDITVTQPPPISIQANTTNATTETSADGSASVQVTGGTPDYTYQWSNGATTANIQNITVGTYSVTVTDANGCTATSTLTVSANCLLEATLNSTDVGCASSDGRLEVIVANANGALTYQWSNGQTGASINGLDIGMYSVTATDALGCTVVASGSVGDGCDCIQPEIITIVVIEATGKEEADGFIEIILDGGNNNFTFQWSNGETTPAINNLLAGLYTVSITDRNNPICSIVQNVRVGNSTTRVGPIEVTSVTAAECGLDNGSAELFPTGLDFQWSDGGTGFSRNDLPAGTYTVTATFDALPGEQDIVEVVIETIGGLDATVAVTQQPDCQSSNGRATITAVGGSGDYSYSWGNGNTRTDLASGSYVVTIVDNVFGCETEVAFVIIDNVPGVLVENLTVTPVSCKGEADGTVQYDIITSNEVANPVTQRIVDAQGNTFSPSALSTGQYCLEIRDGNNCLVGGECFEIVEPDLLFVEISRTPVTCSANGILIAKADGGNGNYIFDWTDIPGTDDAPTRGNVAPGTYSIGVQDAKGCNVFVDNIILNEPSVPTSSLEITQPATLTSNDGSISVVTEGGLPPFRYLWSNGVEDTSAIHDLAPGLYSVTIVDANGCFQILEAELEALCTFIIDTNITNTGCEGNDGRISLDITGGTGNISYQWSTGAISSSIENLAPGPYSVTVVDEGDCNYTASFFIEDGCDCVDPIIENIVIVKETTPNSSDGSIKLEVVANNPTYTWSDPSLSGNAVGGLTAGVYTVTISDGDCSIIRNIPLGNSTIPTIQIESITNTPCGESEGSATLSPDSLIYSWSDGGVGSIRDNLAAGSYLVTATSPNLSGIDIIEVIIETEGGLEATETINQLPDCGVSNGQVSIAVVGGSGNYSYSWGSGNTQTNLPSGTYSVTVIDEVLGCQDIVTFTLLDNVPSVAVTATPTPITCTGGADGQVEITLNPSTNATGPFTQRITDGLGDEFEATDLKAGIYCVEVYDANDCLAGGTCFEITSPNLLEVIVAPMLSSCNDDGAVTLTINGGNGNYTVNWADLAGEANEMNRMGLAAGTYSFEVSDSEGCAASGELRIGMITNPQLTIQTTNATNLTSNDGAATAIATEGTPPYSYEWSNGVNEAAITDLALGIYIVTVTDANGCTAVDSTEITAACQLIVPIPDTVLACANVPTPLNPNPTVGDFNYTWMPGELLDNATLPNPMVTVDRTTIISVVINSEDCDINDSVMVFVPEEVDYDLTEDMAVCSDEEVVIFVDILTTDEGTLIWSSSPDFSDTITTEPEFTAPPGAFYFQYIDEFGCIYQDEVFIDNATIDAEIESDLGLTICQGDAATLSIINNNPDFEFTDYEWLPAPGILNTDFRSPTLVVRPTDTTEYSVVVTNEAGCMDTLFQTINVVDLENVVVAMATPDSIYLSESSELSVTPTGVSVTWADDPSAGSTRTVTPTETTNYFVTVRDENGCEGSDDVTVHVMDVVCGPPNIFFPNAFSPNGDGVNDVLRVRGNGFLEVYWAVFNRWGEMVFEANSEDDVWDGTFEGELVNPDVYGYILRVVCYSEDPPYEEQGNVTVIR